MTGGPLFVWAPGAGASSASAWMALWAARLATLGAVVPFDYPYQRAGKRLPDRLPKLVAAHAEALAEARAAWPGRSTVLAGKSMGSRVGCHLSLEVSVDALVCFGYPLFGQGDPGKRRDEVLLALRTPVLFVQGTRDPLCPLGELEAVRERMAAPSTILVVEEGDHGLEVPRARSQDTADADVLAGVAAFLAERSFGMLAGPSPGNP